MSGRCQGWCSRMGGAVRPHAEARWFSVALAVPEANRCVQGRQPHHLRAYLLVPVLVMQYLPPRGPVQ